MEKYNEKMANKSTIDILNLDSQDVATTYYDYAINNYKEILRKTYKLYDPEYSGIAKEKQNQLIENYQAKILWPVKVFRMVGVWLLSVMKHI